MDRRGDQVVTLEGAVMAYRLKKLHMVIQNTTRLLGILTKLHNHLFTNHPTAAGIYRSIQEPDLLWRQREGGGH